MFEPCHEELQHILASHSRGGDLTAIKCVSKMMEYDLSLSNEVFKSGTITNFFLQAGAALFRSELVLRKDTPLVKKYAVHQVALYFCLGGKADLHLPEKKHSLTDGQFIFISIPPGEYSLTLFKLKKKNNIIGIHFTLDAFRSLIASDRKAFPELVLSAIEHRGAMIQKGVMSTSTYDRMVTLSKRPLKGKQFHFFRNSLFYEMMFYQMEYFIQLEKQVTVEVKMDEQLMRLKNEIEAAIRSNEIPAKAISSIRAPQAKINTLFKKKFGMSIYQFTIDRKLIYAMELLESGQQSMKEVAWTLGYESASSFSRAFFKKYNTRPGAVVPNKKNTNSFS